ncbi:MAG TPA: NAD(P)-dependent oxidoreductase, partial [Myxococcaceae bacterium]|nr:NAD(P)-dependent oxidoreductase [Myxococcaceae bacterium]
MISVLVADEMSPKGVETLRRAAGLTVDVKTGLKPAELRAILGDYQALAVRSATKVTAEVLESARQLKVIGRAGVGVDNIDVDAATRKGIVVMNTPGGNSMAVAELTMAMLLALPRQLVQAVASTRGGRWEKKRFASGHELFQKTVGILGLGNIGSLVAQRCLAFGSTVLVYDPHPSEAARKLGLSVQFVSLEELVRRADYLT